MHPKTKKGVLSSQVQQKAKTITKHLEPSQNKNNFKTVPDINFSFFILLYCYTV